MKMLSLDDAIKAVTMLLDDEGDTDLIWSCDVINNLKNAPSVADVNPIQHGNWEKLHVSEYPFTVRCTACGDRNDGHTLFCPMCGAYMDDVHEALQVDGYAYCRDTVMRKEGANGENIES